METKKKKINTKLLVVVLSILLALGAALFMVVSLAPRQEARAWSGLRGDLEMSSAQVYETLLANQVLEVSIIPYAAPVEVIQREVMLSRFGPAFAASGEIWFNTVPLSLGLHTLPMQEWPWSFGGSINFSLFGSSGFFRDPTYDEGFFYFSCNLCFGVVLYSISAFAFEREATEPQHFTPIGLMGNVPGLQQLFTNNGHCCVGDGDLLSASFTVGFMFFCDGSNLVGFSTMFWVGILEQQVIFLPESPVKQGFEFTGWYYDEDLTMPIDNPFVHYGQSFFPRLEPIFYDLIFRLNGGTYNDSGTLAMSFTIESPLITFPIPIRDRYIFLGWFDNEDFEGVNITILPANSTGSRQFYAAWERIYYSITITLNDGVLLGNIPERYNELSPLIVLPHPIRTGWHFDGWWDNPNFEGDSVGSILPGSTGNRRFYAGWSLVSFRITYILNGGENPESARILFNIQNSLFLLPIPTRTGFTFKGWYTNAGFLGNSVAHIPQGSFGDRTFHARWERIMFSLTFFVRGEIFTTLVFPHGSTLNSFHFLGADNRPVELFADAEMRQEFDSTLPVLSNLVLFAADTFSSVSVVLTRNVNGVLSTQMVALNSAVSSIAIPAPELEGYNFNGWYFDAAFTRRVSPLDTISENTTVFARFSPIPPPPASRLWILWLVLGLVGGLGLVVAIPVIIVKARKRR